MTDPGTQGADPSAIPPVTPPGAPEGPDATDWKTKYEEAMKHSRTWEQRAKDNKAAADELQNIKEKDLTESQKAQKAADKAAAEAASAKAELARYRVAAAKGVPAELLTASDEETLNAQADALLAFRGQSSPPAPDFGQGNRGSEPPQDPNAWLRRMAGR